MESKQYFMIKFFQKKKDALLEEINNFVDSIQTRSTPIVDGFQGLSALEIALEIERKVLKNVK